MTPDPTDYDADLNVELRQVLGLGLLDGRSGNPWNTRDDLGVKDPTFQASSLQERARLRGTIKRRFARWERERRARLVDLVMRTDTDTAGNARLTVEITYENLETGTRQEMELSING